MKILCIEKNYLEVSPNIQNKLNLEELLKEHTKFLSESEVAVSDTYVPLDFMVSIRSASTNLVVETPTKDSNDKRYYVNLTRVQPLPHRGYDLIMYLASVGVLTCVNYVNGFDNIMLQSKFCPIGVFNCGFINPIIYSTIVLKDDTIDSFKSYLKEGYNIVPIKDIKRDGNISAIIDSLVIVKGEENSEPKSNNS